MFSGEINDRKERMKEEYFKTNVLVPNKQNVRRWRHRSGFSPTFSQRAIVRPDGRRLHGNLTLQESPIKYHKCPTNETPAIFSFKLIGSPIQMNKYKDADESENRLKT